MSSLQEIESQTIQKFARCVQKKYNVPAQDVLTLWYNNPVETVYIDGSCLNNGKPTARAGIGCWFGHNDVRNVSHRIQGKQSNNTAELNAFIKCYEIIATNLTLGCKYEIVTDSKYLIQCATTFGAKCDNAKWPHDVLNRELVIHVYNIVQSYPNIKLVHVLAHTNKKDIHSLGNAEADKLARCAVGI